MAQQDGYTWFPHSWEMLPHNAQGCVVPTSNRSLPLLLGTAPAFPCLLAFPMVPAPGDTDSSFLPIFVPKAAGTPPHTPQEPGLFQPCITTLNKTCQQEQAATTYSLSLLFHTSGSQAG